MTMTTQPDDYLSSLRPVPILDGAICKGLDADGHLIFISPRPRTGPVHVVLSGTEDAPIHFTYRVWDDELGVTYVCSGPYGDPRRDEHLTDELDTFQPPPPNPPRSQP